jgi:hypothetical protein
MNLPAPLVECIAQFLPLPQLWAKQLTMLTNQCVVNADAVVMSALDLIDEVIEEGGFMEACDNAKVTPPTHFSSWREWEAWGCLRAPATVSDSGGSSVTNNNNNNGLCMAGE